MLAVQIVKNIQVHCEHNRLQPAGVTQPVCRFVLDDYSEVYSRCQVSANSAAA
jgi:hypothetical protein